MVPVVVKEAVAVVVDVEIGVELGVNEVEARLSSKVLALLLVLLLEEEGPFVPIWMRRDGDEEEDVIRVNVANWDR